MALERGARVMGETSNGGCEDGREGDEGEERPQVGGEEEKTEREKRASKSQGSGMKRKKRRERRRKINKTESALGIRILELWYSRGPYGIPILE